MFDVLGVGDEALSLHIMDSDRKRQILQRAFESVIDQGYDPNDQEIKDYIYENTNAYPYQLTDLDREQLQNYIAGYYATYGN